MTARTLLKRNILNTRFGLYTSITSLGLLSTGCSAGVQGMRPSGNTHPVEVSLSSPVDAGSIEDSDTEGAQQSDKLQHQIEQTRISLRRVESEVAELMIRERNTETMHESYLQRFQRLDRELSSKWSTYNNYNSGGTKHRTYCNSCHKVWYMNQSGYKKTLDLVNTSGSTRYVQGYTWFLWFEWDHYKNITSFEINRCLNCCYQKKDKESYEREHKTYCNMLRSTRSQHKNKQQALTKERQHLTRSQRNKQVLDKVRKRKMDYKREVRVLCQKRDALEKQGKQQQLQLKRAAALCLLTRNTAPQTVAQTLGLTETEVIVLQQDNVYAQLCMQLGRVFNLRSCSVSHVYRSM